MTKLISTPKFLCQSKLLSRVSYGHVSYLMAGADIIESCQHISCLSCRAQLWKLGDWEKGKVGKKICHDPLGAKIKRNCFASRFRLPNCGKFPRLNIAVFCKEPICCWESPTQLLLMQIPVNWSPWLFSPWWKQTLMEWIDLIRPQAFWVTSQGAQCTDLTSKHGEFFGNHREEPIELGVDKHVINASLSGINRHINKQNMGSNKQKHSQTNIICRGFGDVN